MEAALVAGCRAIQLRNKGESARELIACGRELRAMTRRHGALLFVNDRIDVALAIGADGAHLGPDDPPVSSMRAIAPEGFLIGYSADDPGVAQHAVAAGADYIGCGAVHRTATKPDAGAVIGVAGLSRVVRAVDVPVVAIGGVDERNAPEIARSGAVGVAVISAVMGAREPEEATRRLLAAFDA